MRRAGIIAVILSLAVLAACVGDEPNPGGSSPDGGTADGGGNVDAGGDGAATGKCTFGTSRFGEPCKFGP